jgi:hypothetical protein
LVLSIIRSVASCSVLAVLLLVCTGLSTVLKVKPNNHPKIYMSYMYVVHIIAEGGIALTVLIATNTHGVNDGPSWLWLVPCAWRRMCAASHTSKDAMHVALLSHASPTLIETPTIAHRNLLREDTESVFRSHSLSLCSNNSDDSYRPADDVDDDPYGTGIQLNDNFLSASYA